VKLHPIVLLHKFSGFLFHFLAPLGVWGVGALALMDSALIPLPGSMDSVIIGYVISNHQKFLLYCLMAATASALGSLVPFYIGRAGGELFLLKRINRERYERIRDRFERQEFFAMMIPSMLPPPTPLKVFQFAAGVFEMKPLNFVLAVFTGKFIQFLVCSLAVIWFGPTLVHTARAMLHQHMGVVIGIAVAVLLGLVYWFVRKVFDRRRGEKLPVEDGDAQDEGAATN
jgi:membrane protein YqaA with SNARE-associated domain